MSVSGKSHRAILNWRRILVVSLLWYILGVSAKLSRCPISAICTCLLSIELNLVHGTVVDVYWKSFDPKIDDWIRFACCNNKIVIVKSLKALYWRDKPSFIRPYEISPLNYGHIMLSEHLRTGHLRCILDFKSCLINFLIFSFKLSWKALFFVSNDNC